MKGGILTRDITNQKFWLVVCSSAVYGARLLNEVWRALNKIDGDIAVSVDGDGKIIIDGREIGQLVGWNNQPTTPDNNAWTLVTESGRPGRLGRALKRAVENGLTAEEALDWVQRYLGEEAKADLQSLLDDAGDQSDDLAELLKRHLLQNDLPW